MDVAGWKGGGGAIHGRTGGCKYKGGGQEKQKQNKYHLTLLAYVQHTC